MDDAQHAARLDCLMLLGPAGAVAAVLALSRGSYAFLHMITAVAWAAGFAYLGWKRVCEDARTTDFLLNSIAAAGCLLVAAQTVPLFGTPEPSDVLRMVGLQVIALLGCVRPIVTRPWPFLGASMLIVLVGAWVLHLHGTRENLLRGSVACLQQWCLELLFVVVIQVRLSYHRGRLQQYRRVSTGAEVIGAAASDAESQRSSSASSSSIRQSSALGFSMPSFAELRGAMLAQLKDRRATKQDLRGLYLLWRHFDGLHQKALLPGCAALRIAAFLGGGGGERCGGAAAAQPPGADASEDASGDSSSDDSVGFVWGQLQRALRPLS